MKIVKLTAEDILRLKAVEIVPDPDASTVIVSGANGAGKSSVLNSIWLALGGGDAGRALPEPVRKGAKKGTIKVNLGDILVTKHFSPKGSSLEITNNEGALFPSPQAMLDKLIGRLSFDPLAFANAKPKEQLNTLLQALDIDLDEFESERKETYEKRTWVNREVKELEAQLKAAPHHADAPAEKVSVKELMAELDTNRHLRDRQANLLREAEEGRNNIAKAEAHVERLREEIARYDHDIASWQSGVLHSETAATAITFTDPATFVAQIESADEINRKVDENEARTWTEDKLEVARAKSAELSTALEGIDKTKQAAIDAAGLPVEGLGFTAEGVTMNGVPFEQASSAEQLRVSLAIAMAMNPELRVVRVTDGSLLDANSMRIIEEMATAEDFQVWVEVVSDAPIGIHIEEGEVVSVQAAPPRTIEAAPAADEQLGNLLDMFGEE